MQLTRFSKSKLLGTAAAGYYAGWLAFPLHNQYH